MARKYNSCAAIWDKIDREKRRKEAAKKAYERQKRYKERLQQSKELSSGHDNNDLQL